MASTINASSTGSGGLITTGDASGELALQANGVTQATVSSTGLSLASTASINALNTFGFENRLINGGMTIDQRNAGVSYTQVNGQYSLDRWAGNSFDGGAAVNKFSVIQSSTAPTGFSKSLLVTSLAATASSASNIFNIEQKIEGFNFADFMYGTANAQTLTLSFWVRSSLTGTFGGALKNDARNRAYPFTYTISTANTFEYKTVTITGDTTGTWVGATNGTGLWISFGLGVGSTYSGTAGAWGAGDIFSATGATSVVGTNGATWYLTGVQLEKGSQATSFDFRSIGTELALCQRYFYKSIDIGTAVGTASDGGIIFAGVGQTVPSTSYIEASTTLKQSMRGTPTVVLYDRAGASGVCSRILTGVASTNGQNGVAGLIGQNGFYVSSTGSASASMVAFQFTASAEL